MQVTFTPEELDAVEFALQYDLETVEKTIKHEGGDIELAESARLLRSALVKVQEAISGQES
jgi:hypothetical protein